MNCKPKLKVKHRLKDLIHFIELNDIENAKKIIDSSKEIIYKKQDEKDAIYYAVKYKTNEIFNYIISQFTNDCKLDVNFDKLVSSNFGFNNKLWNRRYVYKIH